MPDLATERERQLTTARANLDQWRHRQSGKLGTGSRVEFFSARFTVVKWRSRSVAKSAFYQEGEREEERLWKRGCPCFSIE